ncbi:MAG: hypothetical protein KY434_00045 [Actinobacteria bacterium]|nr:hypothetical protein [Actinomycetota bacterium]
MARQSQGRERRVIRRALTAGAATWLAVTATLVALGDAGIGPLLAGGPPATVVASVWLLLAAVLDVAAGLPVGRRRVAWTVGMVVATLLLPPVLGAVGRAVAGA